MYASATLSSFDPWMYEPIFCAASLFRMKKTHPSYSNYKNIMANSDRTYVGTGPGPEWVTVYYVKPSHCNLCGNLNGPYTLALYQFRSGSHISSV